MIKININNQFVLKIVVSSDKPKKKFKTIKASQGINMIFIIAQTHPPNVKSLSIVVPFLNLMM